MIDKEEEKDNKIHEELLRFTQDLEFVQCLANPYYLKYLSDRGYFEDDNFINYLKYLLYFKKVEYMKYITFERCLIMLELLQYKEFREQLKINNYQKYGDNLLSYADCLNIFILEDWKNRAKVNENNEENLSEKEKKNNEKMEVDG